MLMTSPEQRSDDSSRVLRVEKSLNPNLRLLFLYLFLQLSFITIDSSDVIILVSIFGSSIIRSMAHIKLSCRLLGFLLSDNLCPYGSHCNDGRCRSYRHSRLLGRSFFSRVIPFGLADVTVHDYWDFGMNAVIQFGFVFRPTTLGGWIIVKHVVHFVVEVVTASIAMSNLALFGLLDFFQFAIYLFVVGGVDICLFLMSASNWCLVFWWLAYTSLRIRQDWCCF